MAVAIKLYDTLLRNMSIHGSQYRFMILTSVDAVYLIDCKRFKEWMSVYFIFYFKRCTPDIKMQL